MKRIFLFAAIAALFSAAFLLPVKAQCQTLARTVSCTATNGNPYPITTLVAQYDFNAGSFTTDYSLYTGWDVSTGCPTNQKGPNRGGYAVVPNSNPVGVVCGNFGEIYSNWNGYNNGNGAGALVLPPAPSTMITVFTSDNNPATVVYSQTISGLSTLGDSTLNFSIQAVNMVASNQHGYVDPILTVTITYYNGSGNAIGTPQTLINNTDLPNSGNWNILSGTTTVPKGAVSATINVYDEQTTGVADGSSIMDNAFALTDVELTSCVAPAALPITMLSFTAQAQNNKIAQLQWTTATETNNKGFAVQRGTDGANYATLAFVNSEAINGNSSIMHNYIYTDANPLGGVSYYRLAQTDLDGTVAYYSPTQSVQFNNLVNVYPNPVKTVLTVAGTQPNAAYKLIDASGAVVLHGILQNGKISVAGVAEGIYFLQIEANGAAKAYEIHVVK